MPRFFSARSRVAASVLLATTAAVPLMIVAQPPAAAATPGRAAGTGFGRVTGIAQPGNAGATPDSTLLGVACSERGYCSAGGSYTDKAGNTQAMVVTESRGTWGRAIEVKLPHGAATDPSAEVNGVACTSRGNCVAVGSYQRPGFEESGFIVTQRRGTWTGAAAAPLPKGASGLWLNAISCPAAGSCTAVGFVLKSAFVGLVLAQSHGRWTHERILGPPRGGGPELTGIGCTGPGDCVATGYYLPTNLQTFSRPVAYVQSRGTWGHAIAVKSPKNASGDLSGFLSSACVPGGSCLAAGWYEAGAKDYPLAATEQDGKWKPAVQIRALPPHGIGAQVYGVSCASSRLCLAAGDYSTNATNLLAYLVTDASGRWQDAGGVTGLPANAARPARSFLEAVGCDSAGYCAAVGAYAYYESGGFARTLPMVVVRS
jgi:hypothetical protein